MKNFFKSYYLTHKVIIHSFMWRSLHIFGKQGINFLIFILSAKLLVPYDFGIYNYILTIIFFLVMFGDFGISTAASKYVAEYNIIDKEKRDRVLFNSGLIISLITFIISFFVVFVGPWYLKDKYVYVLWVLPLIFLSPMTSLYDGIFRGLRCFKKLAIISLLVGLVSITFIWPLIKLYGLTGALLSQNIFYFILLLCLGLGYKDFSFKFDKEVVKTIGKYSFIYGIAVLGNYLFIRFGILILGHYQYITELGMYELLNKIFSILLLPFALLGQVIAPNFSELSVKKEYKVIFIKLKKYTLYFFVVGLMLSVMCYILIPLLIKIFLPNYYNILFFEMFPFLVCIFLTNVWSSTIDAGVLVPSGFASIMARFYIVLGILGTLLSFIFINNYGYLGVIYSFTICSFLMVVFLRVSIFIRLYRLL